MTVEQPQRKQKILLIRMLGLGDVTCIGIPALRHFQRNFPDAEIHFLTYAAGEQVIKLAEPKVKVLSLAKGHWPDDLLKAMETFLGLAEDIVAEEYSQIVNLDTWFMPCFLARFLKDAGEPVEGNLLAKSVDELLREYQDQSLKPEFVNVTDQYMQSTWLSMGRWHTPWWQSDFVPDYGYPEFYLKSCCGFNGIDMDMAIEVKADAKLQQQRQYKKVIAVAMQARTEERNYPYGRELVQRLKDQGYFVWEGFDGSIPMRKTLAKLKASDLLITIPSAPQWLATSVGCPSLVVCGEVDPRTLMPDYATEMSSQPVSAEALVESVDSIFAEAQASVETAAETPNA